MWFSGMCSSNCQGPLGSATRINSWPRCTGRKIKRFRRSQVSTWPAMGLRTFNSNCFAL